MECPFCHTLTVRTYENNPMEMVCINCGCIFNKADYPELNQEAVVDKILGTLVEKTQEVMVDRILADISTLRSVIMTMPNKQIISLTYPKDMEPKLESAETQTEWRDRLAILLGGVMIRSFLSAPSTTMFDDEIEGGKRG